VEKVQLSKTYTIGDFSEEMMKVKRLSHRADLTFWEKIYLPEIARGVFITMGHVFRHLFGFVFPPKGKKRSVFTVYYPEETVQVPQSFRGRPVLVQNPDGTERCVACGLCEAICPAKCISIFAGERPNLERYPETYDLDMARCLFCGFCEEVCPKEAIVMSDMYRDLAVYDRKELKYDKKALLVPVEKLQSRIDYIRRIYARCNY